MGPQSGSGAVLHTPQAVREYCRARYDGSGASDYGLDAAALEQILIALVSHWNGGASEPEIAHFLDSLRLEELVLARACVAGNEKAWERFLARFRAVLYGAAHRIAHDDSAARDLADSIYAELYGVSESGRERPSKLLYYSGRGSLEGWLRTVVAQEFVDRYRKTRRETSLEEVVEAGAQFASAPAAAPAVADTRLEKSTEAALQELDPEDRLILASYYLDGRTLAQIGRMLRVHESTISRRLERTSSELRKRIRRKLIESGMSPRQAEETLLDTDVRDLRVQVAESLRQGTQSATFYQREE